MENSILSLPLEKLLRHPDNPNRMSRGNFAKLVRNIKQTGRYEPVIVRPYPGRAGFFQIINGHHRCRALAELGYKCADCVVWEVDDRGADVLLVTLNRLGGSDELGKKLAILRRLCEKTRTKELSKILPYPAGQIERLISLGKRPTPVGGSQTLANPVVFFLSDEQQRVVEEALLRAEKPSEKKMTKAEKRAAAIGFIARRFLEATGCVVGGGD